MTYGRQDNTLSLLGVVEELTEIELLVAASSMAAGSVSALAERAPLVALIEACGERLHKAREGLDALRLKNEGGNNV